MDKAPIVIVASDVNAKKKIIAQLTKTRKNDISVIICGNSDDASEETVLKHLISAANIDRSCICAIVDSHSDEEDIPIVDVITEEFKIEQIERYPMPDFSRDRPYPKNPFIGGKRGQRNSRTK